MARLDNLIDIPIDLLPYINLLGFVINAYLFWKRGVNTVTKEVVELQEKQIEALKEDSNISRTRNHDLANHLQTLTLEVGQLKGQILEKDKKLEEYTGILQNRDPDLLKILTEIREIMASVNDYMRKVSVRYAGGQKVARRNT